MADGIELILADHRRVDALFERAVQDRCGAAIGEVIDALTAHDDAEHAALYPLVGRVLGDAAIVQRAAAAHSQVKKQIDVVKFAEGDALLAAFGVLRHLVADHVADEEQRILPELAAKATAAQLERLGAELLHAKQRVG
jgi:hypothetical protein